MVENEPASHVHTATAFFFSPIVKQITALEDHGRKRPTPGYATLILRRSCSMVPFSVFHRNETCLKGPDDVYSTILLEKDWKGPRGGYQGRKGPETAPLCNEVR